MVVVVEAFAKGNEGDPPTVSAGIFGAVGLIAPNMTDRVNAKGRVQDGEGTADSSQ